jgi:RsiW-degrading membrane proteinase PrsW (M82 family)
VLIVAIALLPVVAFLAALWFMDRFGMVESRTVVGMLAYGALAAAVSLPANNWLLHAVALSPAQVSQYIAPVTEESVKAVLLVALIATGRVGFLVDAAVQGFAVGAGFALFENIWYLQTLQHASLTLWIVRGLGTAILQSATTAIFAIASQTLADRYRDRLPLAFLPGWVAAVILHSAFNYRVLPPVAEMLVLLVVVPLIVLATYEYSERATREWVGAGLDLDLALVSLMTSDAFMVTRFGQHLVSLGERLAPSVIADMYCLLRLELELSVQAKALLLAQGAGLILPVSEDLECTLAERRYLQNAIGAEGRAALGPLQVSSHRDTWHRHLLQGRRTRTVRKFDRLLAYIKRLC